MAIVTINRKAFEKEIGKLDEKMESRISMFGTPVEEITDNEILIEVFPNRPDMLSYQGFKRAFLAYIGKNTGLKTYDTNAPEKDYSVIIENSVKSVRPFTACAIIRGLHLNDERIKELIEIQEKLHTTVGRKRNKVAIGIYPLEEIRLPITFKAMEPDRIKFKPLESDKEMSGLEILQKHPTGKEYAHLLSGKEKFPVFVDANNNVLSMPPIINSEMTGKITEKTKDVFVECSGSDFKILGKCINILATAMADMGAKIYQMELKYSKMEMKFPGFQNKLGKKEITPNLKPEEMRISLGDANKLLGMNFNEKQMKGLLERMGYDYGKGKVKIPGWRTDVLHDVDLIEDIAIAYGYENFVPEIPEISTIGEEDKKEIFRRKISEILSGLGFLETSNYHLTSRRNQFRNMGMQEEGFAEIEESKTDYNILRKDLSHYAMKVLSENSDAEYPQKIFETGRVFESDGKINEKTNLAIAVAPGNFTDLKQAIEYLSEMADFKIEIKESEDNPKHFIQGRVAEILFGGNRIGFIGEIHPRILRNWKIRMPVAILEINLDGILEKI